MVIYFCLVGRNACFEQHTRVPDRGQIGLSVEQCAKELQAKRPKDLEHIKPGVRAYCEYEKAGPDYQVIYDFEHQTVTVERKR